MIVDTIDVLREAHYYPFGMEMVGPWSMTTDTLHPYLYNGKEFNHDSTDVDEDGKNELALGWYDYGARFYDPSVGRFTGVDPFADQLPGYSPYAYTLNNPINLIDPDGRYPWPPGAYAALNKWVKTNWNNYRSTATAMKNGITVSTGQKPSFLQSAGIEVTAATLHFGNYTSQNDASVLSTGNNMDGTAATGTEKAMAGVFIALPISGGAVKKLAGEGVELLGKFVNKFTNQASHLDAKHISAAVGDILGNPITIGAKTYDHLDEVQTALGGLGKQLGKLNDAIDAGSFSGDALEAAQNLRSTLQKQKDQITDVLNRTRYKAGN
ncbi:MAG: RHS repeat-associated core domain-containing protein [Saprospiraceae bacterium]|nr:RHS repeat-associated core domain-containing protein [Saprospiraceae bacterium]